MPINTATATFEEVQKAETSELLALYNKITGEDVKKFADRNTAERRTWKAIGMLAPGEDVNDPKTKPKVKEHMITDGKPKAELKSGKVKRKRTMRFCFAPGSEKDFVEPRKTSLRFKVYEMLNRKGGVLFSEIQKAFKWHEKNTYEAIRLVHATTNIGMWSTQENGDIRVVLVRDKAKYTALVNDEKEQLKKEKAA